MKLQSNARNTQMSFIWLKNCRYGVKRNPINHILTFIMYRLTLWVVYMHTNIDCYNRLYQDISGQKFFLTRKESIKLQTPMSSFSKNRNIIVTKIFAKI